MFEVDAKNRTVKYLYYNVNYGTCLKVVKYENNDELNDIKKELNII